MFPFTKITSCHAELDATELDRSLKVLNNKGIYVELEIWTALITSLEVSGLTNGNQILNAHCSNLYSMEIYSTTGRGSVNFLVIFRLIEANLNHYYSWQFNVRLRRKMIMLSNQHHFSAQDLTSSKISKLSLAVAMQHGFYFAKDQYETNLKCNSYITQCRGLFLWTTKNVE